MGVRNVRYTCPVCNETFRAEGVQGRRLDRDPCCSYECDRWRRHAETRKAAIANWRNLPESTRRNHQAWLTRSR